jgi:hypothetical protein
VLTKSTHYFVQDTLVKCAELNVVDPCSDFGLTTYDNLTIEECGGCASHVLIVLQLSVMPL